MSDASADFFEELGRRGHEPLLGHTSGADCVVRATKGLFDDVATGRVNAMAALLRGELVAEGNPNLLVRLQRLFPSPPAGQ
jgi:hypothetical protein